MPQQGIARLEADLLGTGGELPQVHLVHLGEEMGASEFLSDRVRRRAAIVHDVLNDNPAGGRLTKVKVCEPFEAKS